MVKRQEEEKKSSLIGVETKLKNIGEIIFTAPDVEHYKGMIVVFRENFCETIIVEEVEYLYFRDFNSSIYYAESYKK